MSGVAMPSVLRILEEEIAREGADWSPEARQRAVRIVTDAVALLGAVAAGQPSDAELKVSQAAALTLLARLTGKPKAILDTVLRRVVDGALQFVLGRVFGA